MRRTFAALGERDFRIWMAADLVSITGTWMQALAINWYVLQLTGSATWMGLTLRSPRFSRLVPWPAP